MPLSEIEKGFVNPRSLEYDGDFSIEMTADAPIERVAPASVHKDGSMLYVRGGSTHQSMGAIQMYGRPDRQDPFYFSYNHLICIRDAEGNPLWINHNHR